MATTDTAGNTPSTFTEDFESIEDVRIALNETVHFAFMDITNLNSAVGTGLCRFNYPGEPLCGQVLYLQRFGQITVEFHFPVRRVRFGYATGVSQCQVSYRNADQKLIHTERTPKLGTLPYDWMEYSRDKADIKSIEFMDFGSTTQLDNFTVEV